MDLVRRHFDERADAYLEFVTPQFEPTYRALAAMAATHRPRWVADIAAGDGGLAARVAERASAPVVALDQSMRLIEKGRRVDGAWAVQGRAEQLPLRSNWFDLVICNLSLPLFTDPLAGLRELNRIMAADGMCAVSTLTEISFGGFEVDRSRATSLIQQLIERSPFVVDRYEELRSTSRAASTGELCGLLSGEIGPWTRADPRSQSELIEDGFPDDGEPIDVTMGFGLYELRAS